MKKRNEHRAGRAEAKTEGRRKKLSNKLKRAELQKKRATRRKAEESALLESLRRQGRVVGGVVIPQGAVPANIEQQAPNNSYSPPLYYVDKPFRCVDCGKEEVWTAYQQKWYYEIAKGSIYGQAIRCRSCRQKRRREKKK
jgi:hypothetical protein